MALSGALVLCVLFVAFGSVFVTNSGTAFSTGLQEALYAVSPRPPLVSGSASASFAKRVLARLEQDEARECDPWRRDDIRIAWITVLNASQGVPDPQVEATYAVLGLHPDKVFAAIEARRRAKLGAHYDEFFGVMLPPKKPVDSSAPASRLAAAKAAAA